MHDLITRFRIQTRKLDEILKRLDAIEAALTSGGFGTFGEKRNDGRSTEENLDETVIDKDHGKV
jgi:hypothetical protein